ncbi:MAG: sugar porter family MFS transporter [Verrucomicrobiales bacterium]|nr:sugar porter family MFS transporter [Verrucomicrobiales bacterium]
MNDNSRSSGTNVGYLLLISLVAAFGGFLFGYDTAVVSGAIGFLKAHFQLSADLTGWAASSVLIGCMMGAMMGGPIGDRFGRKASLMLCAGLFFVSSLASAVPTTLSQFAWARFMGGLAIGAASILSPIYIAEIAPERMRGRLVSLYQLAIVIGILAVFFVNLQIQRYGDTQWNTQTGWRWMFASLTLPSALFGLLMGLVPESPRWWMKVGKPEKARRILEKIGGPANAAREVAEIESALRLEQGRWSELFAGGYGRALLVGALLAIFSQFSGINAIMYYGPEVFKTAGVGQDAAFVQTVTVGAINVLFTFVAIGFVDRWGRRALLLIGTSVQTLAHAMVGWCFATGRNDAVLLGGILIFVAAFAMAMGPVSWIVNAEIFPTKLRGRAMAISIFLLWLACYLVSQTFPMLVEAIGPARTFWVYGGCSLVSFVFVLLMVPETKGKTLEEIQAHWNRGR